MSKDAVTGVVSVLLAIVGVAIVALLVSPRAKTAGVLGASGDALSQLVCKAVSPVTGSSCGGPGFGASSTISYGDIIGSAGEAAGQFLGGGTVY
jgi:uncharacterized membrane protein (Fun14 family)